MRQTAIAVLVVLALGACAADTEPARQGPAGGAQSEASAWNVAEPAAAGLEPAALAALTRDIEAGEFPNTHALLVAYEERLVYEEYFRGTDERWGEPMGERSFGPESLHDVRSISKSVTAVLLGIALAERGESLAEAVQRPVADYVGFEVDEARRAILLHHVLTMTPGLEWNEMDVPYTDPTNDEIGLYDAVNPAQYVLERPLLHEPGATWYYSGGTTQVLATIIHELTGQSLDTYARSALFEPLGIDTFEWLGPGGWIPESPAAMSGLRLTARDLARIGSVLLNQGRWLGEQIVPEEWVTLSATRHVPELRSDWSAGGSRGYGYQWWVGTQPSGEPWVAGWGNGNQRLYILPELELVVVILAGEYNRGGGHSERLLERVLEAGVSGPR